jgi:hypothetical protein
VTPGFVVDSSVRRLKPYGVPIYPIGDGTTDSEPQWNEFIARSAAHRSPALSVWRYGVTNRRIWSLLERTPPTG